jgi:hypothetical protein
LISAAARPIRSWKRNLGAETFSAATMPRASRTGAAAAISPSSDSSSAIAQPVARAASIRSASSATSRTVRAVKGCISMPSKNRSRSSREWSSSSARPADVQYAGVTRPTQPAAWSVRLGDFDISVSTSAPCSTERCTRSSSEATSACSAGSASWRIRGSPASSASAKIRHPSR